MSHPSPDDTPETPVKATPRRFFRTTVTITILSEDAPLPEGASLADIGYEIESGGMSGSTQHEFEEISAVEAARALIAQGTDAEFFRLTEHGELIDP